MRSFLRIKKMATDVDVQYFSHLNGLVLSNNWGDMIRLLDTCLVNGLPLASITSASIDAQGDIILNLYADHKCRLFQIIELTGFAPSELNGKYRIKGTPNSTQLILKATHTGKTITTAGTAKLASLGYDIIFRDTNDVKRVYRAKNPTAQHPFIRVDETLSDGVNSYSSTYAKFAMIGLHENMNHIDDYMNSTKLQLPMSTAQLGNNYSISGSGTGVIRGWSKWYYANRNPSNGGADTATPVTGNRYFTICGNSDAFYMITALDTSTRDKILNGCGLFNSALDNNMIPNWFLMTNLNRVSASTSNQLFNYAGGVPLNYALENSCFFTTCYTPLSKISNHVKAYPVMPDYQTGNSSLGLTPSLVSMEIPFYDESKVLRGSLKHVNYVASTGLISILVTAPRLFDNSMYVYDTTYNPQNNSSGVAFYLGELE